MDWLGLILHLLAVLSKNFLGFIANVAQKHVREFPAAPVKTLLYLLKSLLVCLKKTSGLRAVCSVRLSACPAKDCRAFRNLIHVLDERRAVPRCEWPEI